MFRENVWSRKQLSMDADAEKPIGEKKPVKRRSHHSHRTSGRQAEDESSDEAESNQLKHQISFLLNQACNPAESQEKERTSRISSHASASSALDGSSSSRVKMDVVTPVKTTYSEAGVDEISVSKKQRRRADPASAGRSSSERRRRTCDTCGKTFAQPADLKKQ